MGKNKRRKNTGKLANCESEAVMYTERTTGNVQRDGNTFKRDIGTSTDDIQEKGYTPHTVTEEEKKYSYSSTYDIQKATEQSSLTTEVDLFEGKIKVLLDAYIECMKGKLRLCAMPHLNQEDFSLSAKEMGYKVFTAHIILNELLKGRTQKFIDLVKDFIVYQTNSIWLEADFSVPDVRDFIAKSAAYDEILKSIERDYENVQSSMKTNELESGNIEALKATEQCHYPNEVVIPMDIKERINFEIKNDRKRNIIVDIKDASYPLEDNQNIIFDFKEENVQVSFIRGQIYVSTPYSEFGITFRKPEPVDVEDHATQTGAEQ